MADPLILSEPLEVYAGDSWNPAPWQRGYLTDANDPDSFVAYDYSVWTTWTAQWRPEESSETVIDLTVIHDDAAEGTFGVSATPAQTRAMGDSGVFDVQVSNGTDVKTLIKGKTKYREDVTRD